MSSNRAFDLAANPKLVFVVTTNRRAGGDIVREIDTD